MFHFNQLANANLSRSKYGIQEIFFAVWLAVTNEEGGITVKCKQSLALLLAGAMLLPANAFAADLSQFKDFPNDWSSKSLERAIDDGLLNGSNGQINAKGLLTRAQMAAIVARAFGATKSASLSSYKDVLPSAWYYSDMGKAVQMQAFQGANGLLNPDAPITREEAFTVLARAFALEGGGSATLKDFVDGGTVSSWASESVAALVAGGYVNGANGMLNLKNNITRAEFAKVITGMAASYVGAEDVSGKTVEGNMIVRESGASLSGMTINGDLIIADSADKVSLDNVKVTGRIVIRGGADAVGIKNTTAGKGVLVSSPNGAAAISVSGGSVGTVTAKSDLSLSGSVSNVAVTDKATLTVEKNASVGTVTVSAAGSKVTGDGKVTNVQANANNVTVSTKNTKVTAASGVSGVKAGDKTVDAGKTGTVGTAPSSGGSSSGGGSSSSRSDYSYVLMNIPYGEFYKAELNEKAAAVDAVSSATKNKTRIGTLAGGSYHVNPDGSDITGVTYPVRVKTSDLSGLKQVTNSDSVKITVNKKGKDEITTYTGREALFESASYSYYALSDTPSYYKEATLTDGKWSFGKATGAASEGTATIAKFKTSGHHTDYEIKVESDKIKEGQKVSAVVLTDTDGNTYGLRHVAEIWRATELGFESDSALAGKTISAVTYYTDDGVIKLNLEKKLYVPVISGAKAEVAKSDADAKETTLSLSSFPEDFAQNVKVPEGMSYEDGKIKFGSALPGAYTVTVSDAKGKYADVTASFTVSTSKVAAKYDSSLVSLKKADNAEDADFANFLKNITKVTIGDKEYDATGKKAVTIIKKDGAIDEDAKEKNEALFADGKEKTLTVSAAGYPDLQFSYTPTYTYAYAAVPYDVYWQSEGVYLNKDSKWDDGFDTLDGHNEYDKGAFDAVSRATTNHGLHRGSFQQSVVIHTKDTDKDYYPVAWTDGDNFVDADSKTCNKNEIGMTSYKITGIKYVPVKVKSYNFAEFCKHYTVTQNGETLQGGYSENNLNAYTAVAAVDKDTNGLKEVTLGTTNGYTFGKRQTGTGSGIKGEKLATAADIVTTPARNDASYGATGSYGETVRVNLTGDGYGALGDKMQTVLWEYYGDDSTYTNKVATYGTKFAADNWMHKSMGIQLGLTDSLRCNVSETEGKGIGYWKVTVYALGYEDYSTEFKITADNLPKVYGPITDEQKTQLTELAAKAKKYLDDSKAVYPEGPDGVTKKTLQDHYAEATEMITDTSKKENDAAELITELTGYLAKMDAANASTKVTKYGEVELIIPKDWDDEITPYTVKVAVTVDGNGVIQSVVDNGTECGSANTSYWNKALHGTKKNGYVSMFDKFKNLDLTGVNALKTDPEAEDSGKTDAVSGATISCNTIKEAVKDALSK